MLNVYDDVMHKTYKWYELLDKRFVPIATMMAHSQADAIYQCKRLGAGQPTWSAVYAVKL